MPSELMPLQGPHNFIFTMKKIPEINFWVQKIILPKIDLGTANQATSVHDLKIPGETLTFDTLNLTFTVDERMNNYRAMFSYMTALGYPEGNEQYRKFLNLPMNQQSPTELAKGYSDATLNIMDASNNSVLEITFVDCFPTSLGEINFTTTNTDTNQVVVPASFEYSYFRIKSPFDPITPF